MRANCQQSRTVGQRTIKPLQARRWVLRNAEIKSIARAVRQLCSCVGAPLCSAVPSLHRPQRVFALTLDFDTIRRRLAAKFHEWKLPLSVKILDIGCGNHKWPGSIGLDIVPLEGVDVVHDLNQFPYPFPDDSFDRIRVIHVIEHIQSIPRTMEEIHRIARQGALIDIETPHYTDASSWQDPSHIWHLNTRSFDFFLASHATNYYSKARFEVESSYVMLLKLYKWLGLEFLVNLENKLPRCRFLRKFWEQYLCFIVRGKVMTFRLKAIKPG